MFWSGLVILKRLHRNDIFYVNGKMSMISVEIFGNIFFIKNQSNVFVYLIYYVSTYMNVDTVISTFIKWLKPRTQNKI